MGKSARGAVTTYNPACEEEEGCEDIETERDHTLKGVDEGCGDTDEAYDKGGAATESTIRK